MGGISMENEVLSIVDKRTKATYELALSRGAVRAMDFRQIKTSPEDFGVMRHAPCSVLVVQSHPHIRAANLIKSGGITARSRQAGSNRGNHPKARHSRENRTSSDGHMACCRGLVYS